MLYPFPVIFKYNSSLKFEFLWSIISKCTCSVKILTIKKCLFSETMPALITQARSSRSKANDNICDLKKIGGKNICLCNGMGLSFANDLFGGKTTVKVRLSDNSIVSIDPKDVWHLDISDNQLNYFEIRTILSKFTNLNSLDVSSNDVRFLTGFLISTCKNLKKLEARKCNLFYVSQSLVSNGFDFELLDLSENPNLLPACLNQTFYRKRVINQCFAMDH